MNRNSLLIVCIALLQACSVTPSMSESSYQDSYQFTTAYLDWRVNHEVRTNGIEGMTVLVLDEDKSVYEHSVGYANKDLKLKADANTAYRSGSIGKLFTATAIMQLHEQGKLDIDQPLNRYLPEFSIHTRYGLEGITLRRMLTHYSGLPSDHLHGIQNPQANETLLAELKNEYVAFPPDTVQSYSNLAYNLLGRVVERVSGLSYEDYMQAYLFEPLAMRHASLGVPRKSYMAQAYAGGRQMEFPGERDIGAGDISLSAHDLALFAQMVFNQGKGRQGRVLQAETLEQMLTPQNRHIPLGEGLDMGLGWFLHYPEKSLYGLQGLVWHDGSTAYFNSVLLVNREAQLTVIVMSNSLESAKIVNRIAQKAMLLAVESKTGYRHEVVMPTSRASGSANEALLRTLPGRYVSTYFGEVEINEKRGKLFAESQGITLKMQPMDDNTLGLKYKAFGLIPLSFDYLEQFRLVPVEVEGDSLLRIQNGPVVAQKIPEKALPAVWEARLGQYRHINPDDFLAFNEVTVSDQGGLVYVQTLDQHNQEYSLHLQPVDHGRAKGIGYGRLHGMSGVFYLSEEGKHRFRYSGLEFEKLDD